MSLFGDYPEFRESKTDLKKLKETKDIAYNTDKSNIDAIKKRFSHNYSNTYYENVLTTVTSFKFQKILIDTKILKITKKELINKKYTDLLKKSFIIEKALILLATRINEDETFYGEDEICDIKTMSLARVLNESVNRKVEYA